MSDDIDHDPKLEDHKRKQGPRRMRLADGSHVTLPTAHLSPSAASMYLKCPRQYWFRYIMGIKNPPGVAQIQGISGHEALKYANYRYLRTGGTYPKVSKVIDRFRAEWAQRSREITMSTWAAENMNRKTAETLIVPSLELYMKEHAPKIEVAGAETPMRKNVRGLPIVGILDLRVGDGETARIDDYKFCGPTSPYLKNAYADESLQLATYALLGNVRRAGFICIVKGKSPKVQRTPTVVSPARKETTRREYVHIAKGISAGVFPRCEPNFLCSQRFCGYWSMCRGAKDGKGKQPD